LGEQEMLWEHEPYGFQSSVTSNVERFTNTVKMDFLANLVVDWLFVICHVHQLKSIIKWEVKLIELVSVGSHLPSQAWQDVFITKKQLLLEIFGNVLLSCA